MLVEDDYASIFFCHAMSSQYILMLRLSTSRNAAHCERLLELTNDSEVKFILHHMRAFVFATFFFEYIE